MFWSVYYSEPLGRTMCEASQIFSPFRALGLCCNHVPLALRVKGKRGFIATSVGRAYHLYNVSYMHMYIYICTFAAS